MHTPHSTAQEDQLTCMKVEYLRCLLASSDFRSAWRHGAAMTQFAAYTSSLPKWLQNLLCWCKAASQQKRPAFGLLK